MKTDRWFPYGLKPAALHSYMTAILFLKIYITYIIYTIPNMEKLYTVSKNKTRN